MRYLIDTHVLLWQLNNDDRLTIAQRAIFLDLDHDIVVSDVSLIEIAIKIRVGKLRVDFEAVQDWIARQGFQSLAVIPSHAARLALLPKHHRDPFDGLLIAQAQVEDLTLVSSDRAFPQYDVALAS